MAAKSSKSEQIIGLMHANLVVEAFDDGSAAVYDRSTDAIHSLNPAAYKVWQLCVESARTPAEVQQLLERELGAALHEDVALNAVSQLEAAGLVETTVPEARLSASFSRRGLIKRLMVSGAIAAAIPLVETLTRSEQVAYAASATSPATTTTTPAPTTTVAPTTTAAPTTTPEPTTTTPKPTTTPPPTTTHIIT